MKIRILNVKYSPNLGDGVIADCLEAALRRRLPEADIASCDLAGREAYGDGLNRSRALVMGALDAAPGPVRRQVVAMLLRRLIGAKLAPHYAAALEGADAVVLGGGQLLADADLNFPMKIAAAVSAARRAGAEVSVYGVGVSKAWSAEGAALFQGAIGEGLVHAGVRDEGSGANWRAHFGAGADAIVRDPGVLAEHTYGPPDRPPRSAPLIGLGVTHPSTLKLHADDAGAGGRDPLGLFADLAGRLADLGHQVELFTNGARDDEAFAEKVLARLGGRPGVTLAPPPGTPKALSLRIAGYDGLIAHRLHANIVAFSYGVPHVGLGWDAKLPAFFASVGRGEYVVSGHDQAPEPVLAALQAALADPIPDAIRETVAAEAEAQIAALADRLAEARAHPHDAEKRRA